ncbi:MAG: RAMP superfamily CRISPR-associated protein, partial [Acidimicrobiales bacterium]
APGSEPAMGDKVLFEKAVDRKTVTRVELWTAERSAALARRAPPPPPPPPVPEPRPAPRPPAAHRAPPPPVSASFVNPYNFVPLRPGGVERRPLDPAAHLSLSGTTVRLTVELTFETVASVSPVRRPDHPTNASGVPQWFVRRDASGAPWIPGSSVKGAIRTVFEALSGSCLSQFDDTTAFSWRPIVPSQPGFLRRLADDQWELEPAVDIRLRPTNGSVPSTGDAWRGTKQDRGRGNLHLWYEGPGAAAAGEWVIAGFAPGKKWHRVFEKRPGAAKLRVTRELILAADAAQQARREADADELANRARAGAPAEWLRVALEGTEAQRRPVGRFQDMDLSTENVDEPVAVWYRAHGQAVTEIGSPALMRVTVTDRRGEPVTLRRIVLRETNEDLATSFLPCGTPGTPDGHACPACQLFGAVGVNRSSSGLRGRVRFGTARATSALPPSAAVELKPVGRPHASAQTFYLWDPDNPDDPAGAAYAGDKSRLRGRKFYWHRPGTATGDVAITSAHRRTLEKVASKQLQAKELIPEGTRFRFDVDVEGATTAELGLVVLCLQPELFGELLTGEARRLRLKLGGGKGLGMGTAWTRIVAIKELDPAARYSADALLAPRNPTSDEGESDEEHVGQRLGGWGAAAVDHFDLRLGRPDVDALLALLDTTTVPPDLLTYPPGPGAEPWKSFEWFGQRAAHDSRWGFPSDSRRGRAVDLLRTAEETASGNFQWRE